MSATANWRSDLEMVDVANAMPRSPRQIYILDTPETHGTVQFRTAAGVTGVGMAGDVREAIEQELGLWRGYGFATVIDLKQWSNNPAALVGWHPSSCPPRR